MARKGTAKEVFIQRALDLFMKNGVRTTMDEISRQLKISKRTIYEQFDDKTDLMRVCISSMIEAYPERSDPETDNVIEILYSLVKNNVMNLFGQRSRFIMNLHMYYPELYDEMIAPRIEDGKKYLLRLIYKGLEKGYVREDVNPEVFFSYMLRYAFYVTSDTDNLFKRCSHDEILHSALLPVIRGILTEKGQQEMDEISK